MKMAPLALAGSSAKLLNEESVRYLEKKPEAKAIMGLEGGDKAWGEAKPVIEELGKVLKGNGGGPFVLGKEGELKREKFHFSCNFDEASLADTTLVGSVVRGLCDCRPFPDAETGR